MNGLKLRSNKAEHKIEKTAKLKSLNKLSLNSIKKEQRSYMNFKILCE